MTLSKTCSLPGHRFTEHRSTKKKGSKC